MTAQAQAASVLIDINIESFVDLSAKADPFRLKQILLNLLSNAIRYNRKHGSIHLSAATLDDGCVRVDVRDGGIGIAKDDHDSAFEAFNRLDQESGPISGAGLGLTISQQLAKLMGGRITVESEVGRGSVFSISLKPGEEAHPTGDFIRLQVGDQA